jgi:hypothetical protein
MSRFFFYIVNNGEVIPDHEGTECSDLHWAKAEAVATARDVARQQIAEHRSLKNACIEIRDREGRILSSVNVHEVLDNPERPDFGAHCEPERPSHRLN